MNKKSTAIFCICALCALILTCSCSTTNTVPFSEAHNYFFRNDAKIPESPKITTEEQFDSLFGMAATMGPNGTPTAIDFTKQFVIAVVLPETDIETELTPVSLAKANDQLTFTYKCKKGEKTSYTMQPLLMIVVDKKHETANISLQQE